MVRADKGKKRHKYDNSHRRELASIRDLMRTMKDIARLKKPGKVGRSRKERRHDARRRLLPVDLRCPRCRSGPLLNTRQWVFNKYDRYPALCLSCHRAIRGTTKARPCPLQEEDPK